MAMPGGFSSFPERPRKDITGNRRQEPVAGPSSSSFQSFPLVDKISESGRLRRDREYGRDMDSTRYQDGRRREPQEDRHHDRRDDRSPDTAERYNRRRDDTEYDRYRSERTVQDYGEREGGKSSSGHHRRRDEDEELHYARKKQKTDDRERDAKVRNYRDDPERDRNHQDQYQPQQDGNRHRHDMQRHREEPRDPVSGPGKFHLPARPIAAIASSAFFIDTTGDPDVLRYGSINPRKAVKHNVAGFGTVIGLPSNHRIEKNQGKAGSGPDYGSGVAIEIRGPGGYSYGQGEKGGGERPSLGSSSAYHKAQTANSAIGQQNNLALPNPIKLDRSKGKESGVIRGQADFIGVGRKSRAREDRTDLDGIRRIDMADSDDTFDDDVVDVSHSPAESESVHEVETPDEALRRRTRDFEIRLSAEPGDIKGWIAYATMQLRKSEKVFFAHKGHRGDVEVDNARRGETEVAMSILDKAFSRHPANEQSIEMQRVYLKLAQNIWPVAKVTQRYQGVLKLLEGSNDPVAGRVRSTEGERMDFWLEYIEWREGRGMGSVTERDGQSSGGVEEVVAVYLECMKAMQDTMQEHPSRQEEIEANLVYLTMRLLCLLRQAGYAERATATLQALLELTFFKPDELKRSRTTGRALRTWHGKLLQSLEEFWDADLPRIGETGAKGWRNLFDQDISGGVTLEALATPPDSAKQAVPMTDPFTAWYEAETRADKQGAHPARPTDLDVDEEDPFRIILFSDIRDSLFVIQCGEVKLQLVYATLGYLGINIRPPDTGSDAQFALDPYLASDIHPIASFWPTMPSLTNMDAQHAASDSFGGPAQFWLTDISAGFGDCETWFRSPRADQMRSVDASFCRNVFTLLRPVVSDITFRSGQVAFEAGLSAKTAAKLAKSLLAIDRYNLDLYADYARVLRSSGIDLKLADAVNVYWQAIQGSYDDADHFTASRMRLFADFAELEWLQGHSHRCLAVLCAAASETQPANLTPLADVAGKDPDISASLILQARQYYRSVPSTSTGHLLLLTTLFEYYCVSPGPTDQSLGAALEHLSHIISGQSEFSSPVSEAAYQLGARLLHMHRKRQPFVAGGEVKMAEWLEKAITTFPNNTMFMTLLLDMESGAGSGSGRIFSRLQRLLNEVILDESGPSDSVNRIAGKHIVGPRTWAWGVWAEARLVGPAGFWSSKTGRGIGIGAAGLGRVRRILERALDSTSGKNCLPLWLLFIDFEISQNKEKTAKALCYRAVARLGGCKDIYMLPFTPGLRPHFSPQELNSWSDLMLEKGIRVRVPTDRFWCAAQINELGMFNSGMAGTLGDTGDGYMEEEDPYAKIRQEQQMRPT